MALMNGTRPRLIRWPCPRIQSLRGGWPAKRMGPVSQNLRMMLRPALIARLAFIAQQSRWLARGDSGLQLFNFEANLLFYFGSLFHRSPPFRFVMVLLLRKVIGKKSPSLAPTKAPPLP